MPVPLILGAVALAAAGVGVKKGVDAKNNFDEAKSVMRRAESDMEHAKSRLEASRAQTQDALESLGKLRLEVESTTVQRFLAVFKQIHSVNYKPLKFGNNTIRLDNAEVSQMEVQSLRAVEVTKAGFDGLATGALAAIGASGVAGTLGVASTGTAISSLAGVAATNATLAWLGGGSLAAGGFGMAGGMAVLGGLVAGPALAVIGIAAAAKSEKALTQAYEQAYELNRVTEQFNNANAMLYTLRLRVDEVDGVIRSLAERMVPVMERSEELVKEKTGFFKRKVDYNKLSEAEKATVDRMVLFSTALNQVLKLRLLQEDGSLEPGSDAFLDDLRAAVS